MRKAAARVRVPRTPWLPPASAAQHLALRRLDARVAWRVLCLLISPMLPGCHELPGGGLHRVHDAVLTAWQLACNSWAETTVPRRRQG
jgi:hypothetical protein